jgi:hypothetical protein
MNDKIKFTLLSYCEDHGKLPIVKNVTAHEAGEVVKSKSSAGMDVSAVNKGLWWRR